MRLEQTKLREERGESSRKRTARSAIANFFAVGASIFALSLAGKAHAEQQHTCHASVRQAKLTDPVSFSEGKRGISKLKITAPGFESGQVVEVTFPDSYARQVIKMPRPERISVFFRSLAAAYERLAAKRTKRTNMPCVSLEAPAPSPPKASSLAFTPTPPVTPPPKVEPKTSKIAFTPSTEPAKTKSSKLSFEPPPTVTEPPAPAQPKRRRVTFSRGMNRAGFKSGIGTEDSRYVVQIPGGSRKGTGSQVVEIPLTADVQGLNVYFKFRVKASLLKTDARSKTRDKLENAVGLGVAHTGSQLRREFERSAIRGAQGKLRTAFDARMRDLESDPEIGTYLRPPAKAAASGLAFDSSVDQEHVTGFVGGSVGAEAKALKSWTLEKLRPLAKAREAHLRKLGEKLAELDTRSEKTEARNKRIERTIRDLNQKVGRNPPGQTALASRLPGVGSTIDALQGDLRSAEKRVAESAKIPMPSRKSGGDGTKESPFVIEVPVPLKGEKVDTILFRLKQPIYRRVPDPRPEESGTTHKVYFSFVFKVAAPDARYPSKVSRDDLLSAIASPMFSATRSFMLSVTKNHSRAKSMDIDLASLKSAARPVVEAGRKSNDHLKSYIQGNGSTSRIDTSKGPRKVIRLKRR